MPPTNDRDSRSDEPVGEALLRCTRIAVLNVLIGVGLLIAVSGWLIRRRAEGPMVRPPQGLRVTLLTALVVVAVASYLVRRAGFGRSAYLARERREARFFWSHVGAAAITAAGVLLGLGYGWYVAPDLERVIPFWVVPLALGLLAIPRRGELDDLGP
jgi:hypothetical protein